MSLKRLDGVYYWTSDMDRAVAFYRDVVGLSLSRREGDNWAEFEAGDARFSLHLVVEGHPATPGGGSAGGTAVFEVDDLDEARRSLEARGVSFHEHVGEVE